MERIPFDYDKYAADRSAWKVFTNDDTLVAFLIKSSDEHERYPYQGIVVDKDGILSSETWTIDGWHTMDGARDCLSLKDMEYIGKEKPVETKIVSSLTPRLRNIYYSSLTNSVVMGIKTHETWIEAMEYANRTCLHQKNLEHLCVSSLEEHPQIREILIAKGLAEVVVDPKLQETE